MPQYFDLTPSYGRDYKSKKEVLADWEADKDFTIASTGQQINKQDAQPGMVLNIRYKGLTQIAQITIK